MTDLVELQRIAARYQEEGREVLTAKAVTVTMKPISTSEMKKIDSETAKYWLQYYNYKHQRRLRPTHVKFLVSEMLNNRFQPTATIAFAIYKEQKHLVNGQHTLHAIKDSQITQELAVYNHYVTTEEDIALLYSHYDIGLVRTHRDAYSAYDLTEKYGLPKETINFFWCSG